MESTIQTQQILAAIMFTDIISFSKMTGNNEKKALSILKEHNRLLSDQFTKHNGCIIKELGDGYLTEFSSSLESVNAAIAIQHSLYVYNATQETDNRINIRIGIHLGDIVKTDNEDILGDGVNIASRIEPFSEPNGGGLCFSQQIYDQVHNKINFDIESIGKKKLKNITKPYELYRVILPFQKSDIKSVGKRKVKNSIAVLPFENMSPDKDNEYFADGITEQLLNVMAKEEEMKVISRTSAFTYKNSNKPINQIGRELNVEYVLEGSVRKAGNKVRITAQLIQVADDFHLWSETYDRNLDDIFSIQDEIASIILTELLDRIVSCKCCKTHNVEAFNLYAEGRHHWSQRSEKELNIALECFQKCLEIDPEFTLAYSGLVDTWFQLAVRTDLSTDEIIPKCKEILKKADDLGDVSAEIYASHAQIYDLEGKHDLAIDYFQTSIEQNPNYASTYHWLANRYSFNAEFDKAIETINKAIALDPKSPIIHYAAAGIFTRANKLEKAKLLLNETNELLPSFQGCEIRKGHILEMQYKWEEAEILYNNLAKLKHYNEDIHDKIYLNETMFIFYFITNQHKKLNALINNLTIISSQTKIKKMIIYANTVLGNHYRQLNNFNKSAEHYLQAVNNDTDFPHSRINFAHTLILNKQFDDAFNVLKKARNILQNNKFLEIRKEILTYIETTETFAYIMMQDNEKAYLGIHKIKNMDISNESDRANALFNLYFSIGDLDKGFLFYEKHKEIINRYDNCIIRSPLCNNAHKDKRYIDILKEMKLYDYWKDSL